MEVKRRYGELRDVGEDRTAEFIISSPTRDRHKTVLNQENWDLRNYEKNPIVAFDHEAYGGGMFKDFNPDNIVGTGEVWLEGENLMGRVTFEPEDVNPLAEKIWKKVNLGTIRATSVGFYPLKDEKGKIGKYGEDREAKGEPDETFYYHGQELLEWSIVPLPSNPDAIKNAIPEDKEQFIRYILTEALGDKFKWEEIESLTVQGVLNIINGGDFKKIIEAEAGKKYDPAFLEKRIKVLDLLKSI